MLGLGPNRTAIPAQEFREFIHRSIDRLRVGPCLACLSHDFPCGFARSRPGRGLGDSGLDHYPCTERAGAWRLVGACVGAGGRDRRRAARRWIGVLDRTSGPTRNLELLADGELSARDQAERSVLSPLGRAGGVLRALRAADPRLRADHGRRAGYVATALFRRQHPGGPAMGTSARVAGGSGGIGAAPIRRDSAPYRDRQALLDADCDRRRVGCRAGGLDHPPPAWRRRDRAGTEADSKGYSIGFLPEQPLADMLVFRC